MNKNILTTTPSDDYDKIMLSFKERRILHRILKKQEVPDTFCSDQQKELFRRYQLIYIQQDQIINKSGRPIPKPGAPITIKPTDKTFRYFLYRKEDYFKGKLPVVIALVALIISIFSLALQFFS